MATAKGIIGAVTGAFIAAAAALLPMQAKAWKNPDGTPCSNSKAKSPNGALIECYGTDGPGNDHYVRLQPEKTKVARCYNITGIDQHGHKVSIGHSGKWQRVESWTEGDVGVEVRGTKHLCIGTMEPLVPNSVDVQFRGITAPSP